MVVMKAYFKAVMLSLKSYENILNYRKPGGFINMLYPYSKRKFSSICHFKINNNCLRHRGSFVCECHSTLMVEFSFSNFKVQFEALPCHT